MIQSLPCPGCHRTLVLAADASLKAVLRCRHCSHQFVLGEMIESELGFWEVVDDPQALEAQLAPTSAADGATNQASTDAELSVTEDSEYVSPQDLLKKQAEKKNVDWSKYEPNTHEHSERMRRKNKSPIWSTLSVLLGGLASLPIATLLIWHLLGKDPLHMGPVVGRYVPWIVPAKFQSDRSDRFAMNPDSPPPGQSGFRKFDAVIENRQAFETESAPGELVDAEINSSDNPSVTNSAAPYNLRARERRAPQAFPSSPDGPVAQNFSVADAEPGQNSDSSASESANNVFTLIHEAGKGLESWGKRSDDREINKLLAKQIYGRLTSLPLVVETIPPTSPMRRLVRNELQSLGKMLDEQRDLRKLIQGVSKMELSSQPNTSMDSKVGVALVVDIDDATEIDGQWQVTTTSANSVGGPATKVFAPIEIATGLKAGQQIFVLGTLAEEPATAAPIVGSSKGIADAATSDDSRDDSRDPTNAEAAEVLASDKSEATQPMGRRVDASFVFVLESAAN